jgi:hypothetical protein
MFRGAEPLPFCTVALLDFVAHAPLAAHAPLGQEAAAGFVVVVLVVVDSLIGFFYQWFLF